MNNTFEFLNGLRTRGIKVTALNGQLKVNAPQGVMTPDLKKELTEKKQDILGFLELANRKTTKRTPIVSITREEDLPVSFAQERLWFLEKFNPGQPTYNIPLGLLAKGPLNMAALATSVNDLILRHETLRTTFVEIEGKLVTVAQEDVTIAIEDLSNVNGEDAAIHEFVHRLFDFNVAPLMRVGILSRSENETLLLFSVHHMIADGWSIGILLKDLFTIYEAHITESVDPPPDLPIQFADFAYWQRTEMSDANLAGSLNFWSEHLAGAPPLLDLPTDFPRSLRASSIGNSIEFMLPVALADGLRNLSRRSGTTLYMTLLAAFQTLLFRYSRQEDIVIGSPIANRDLAEVESVVGFFTNTLAMRAQIEPEMSFESLLAQVRESTLNVMEHQHIPFDQVVETLNPERNQSYNPVYQVLFALQNTDFDIPQLPNLSLEIVWLGTDTAKMDMFLEMRENDDATIAARLEYNVSLFKLKTISQMRDHFVTLLHEVTANPKTAVDRINLLSTQERIQLIQTWNQTASASLPYALIHKYFEHQVAKSPENIAIEIDNVTLTYAELNQKANQLAHYLQSRGAQPDMLIGIFLPRSIDMIVAVLGILKAGSAYLPLDPIYPTERRAYMLNNAQAPFVLTHQTMLSELSDGDAEPICLDSQWETIAQFPEDNPSSDVTSENLLYVIYTSGSTGKPKGVALPHRAIANLINWQLKETVLSDGARTAQFTSLSFDVSCQEIFTTFCTGGTLVMVTELLRKDMTQLAHFLNDQRVERLYLPFIALQQLAEIFDKERIVPTQLREIITAGEQLQITDALRRFFKKQPSATLINQYGPSESHVVTAYTLVGSSNDWVTLPPIGKPIDNTQIYLLDKYCEPVPVGIVGELYIGGVNVAQGYINRPEITAERFIPNPFPTDLSWPGGENLLYRTGDLARYLPDGNIQYLGRADSQVKLRGYRIELGEIESVLASHPSVQEAVAVVREDTPGDKRIVAYLVTTSDLVAEDVRQYIHPNLPDYMLPATFMFLDKMPLTPSGKVTRRALPEPEYNRDQSKSVYMAPRNELEEQMIDLWQQVLKVNPIGIHDNFFEIGGHSLMALRLFSQMEEITGRKMPLSTLFEAPTIAELATLMSNNNVQNREWSVLVPIQPKGGKPPFFYVAPFSISVVQLNDIGSQFKERPFYGIQPLGLGENEDVHATIEEMAAYNIKAMQSIQPQGPYYLGGHCAGAWIAYEMALQLEQQGNRVGYLILVDSPSPDYEEPGRGSVSYVVSRMSYYMGDRRLLAALGWKLKLQAEKWLLYRHGSPQSQRIQEVRDIHDNAFHQYEVRKGYKGPMTIVRSSENINLKPTEEWYKNWTYLTPQEAEIVDIHSTHAMLIFNPQAETLAKYMISGIEQASTQPMLNGVGA